MKRREFIAGMSMGAAGTVLPLVGRASNDLCPPILAKAVPGTYATTECMPATSPSWYAAAASGQWTTLPNSVLGTSGVMENGWNHAELAWSGGILNTSGLYVGTSFLPGTFLVVWGGGHVDSGLNAIYCFGPLESPSPQWYLPRPSTSPMPQNVEFDSSGNPVARHVYDSISYLPKQNWMFAAGTHYRYVDSGGGADTQVYQFNIANPAANQPWMQRAAMNSVAGGYASTVSIYDPVNDGIWAVANYNVMFYKPGVDSWSINGSGGLHFNMANAGSALDTKRGIWAIWAGRSDQAGLIFYSVGDGISGVGYQPATTGAGPTRGASNGSIIYDSAADCFVVWYNGGRQVWVLNAPSSHPYQGGNAWTWSSILPTAGATPTAESGLGQSEQGYATGTYGRFAYVPHSIIPGYVLMNRVGDPIYFFKT